MVVLTAKVDFKKMMLILGAAAVVLLALILIVVLVVRLVVRRLGRRGGRKSAKGYSPYRGR